jgi:hypothetical protein
VLYSGSPPADVAEALKDGTIEALVMKPAGVAELLTAISGSIAGEVGPSTTAVPGASLRG